MGFDAWTTRSIFALIFATSRPASAVWPVTSPSWRIWRYASGNERAPSWWTTTIPSLRSAVERPLGSYAMTTRSGRYAAIASTFGVKPESFVLGAVLG